ncbi:MAG: hypothetical protein ACRDCW_03755 [Sarcina sp.]
MTEWIWSSNPVLIWDTSKSLSGPNGENWKGNRNLSYGLPIDSNGYVWNTSYGQGQIRKYSQDGKLLGEAVTEKDKTSLITYTYDKVGNRLTKVEGGKTTLK